MSMLPGMQYAIVRSCGHAIALLLAEMQDEHELFASANTLAETEAQLLVMAQTLAHLPEALQTRLTQVDWHGWSRLQQLLEQPPTPTRPEADAQAQTGDENIRREAVWYGIKSLTPATLELLANLRRREPVWFGLDY